MVRDRSCATICGAAAARQTPVSSPELTFALNPTFAARAPARLQCRTRSGFVNIFRHFTRMVQHIPLTFGTATERSGTESPTCPGWPFVHRNICQCDARRPPYAETPVGDFPREPDRR